MGRFAFVLGVPPSRAERGGWWPGLSRRTAAPQFRVRSLAPVESKCGRTDGVLVELTESRVSDWAGLVRTACQIARTQGADVIGFGLAQPVSGRLAGELAHETGAVIATGHGYMAAAGIAAIRSGARRRGWNLARCTVGILGADQPVGAAVARELVSGVGDLVLIGSDLPALQTLVYRLRLEHNVLCRLVTARSGMAPGVDVLFHDGSDADCIVAPTTLQVYASQVIVPGAVIPLLQGWARASYAEMLLLALDDTVQQQLWQQTLPPHYVSHLERIAARHRLRLGVRAKTAIFNER